MKIDEVLRKENKNKKFKDKFGNIWVQMNNTLQSIDEYNFIGDSILEHFNLGEIVNNFEFEEVKEPYKFTKLESSIFELFKTMYETENYYFGSEVQDKTYNIMKYFKDKFSIDFIQDELSKIEYEVVEEEYNNEN